MYRKLKAESENGNLLALALVSKCLYFGKGVERNTKAAKEVRSRFLELAIEARSDEYESLEWSDILYYVGFFYVVYDGLGEKGVQYITESMDLGNADAAVYLSYLYYIGYGVEQDVGKADEVVRIAMRRGSMYFLVLFYQLCRRLKRILMKLIGNQRVFGGNYRVLKTY